MSARVMGIDAGFAATGIVIVEIKSQGEMDLVIYSETCRTERSAKKRGVRVADDDAERCRALATFIRRMVAQFRPHGAIVELPGGGAQGARANRAMGMATGIMAATLVDVPTEWVTPQMIKKAATGRNDGSKEAVQEAVSRAFSWEDGACGNWKRPKWAIEHVCDAAGAVLAAKDGTLIQMLRRMSA